MSTPVAIAFTPNYFVPAATMLKSMLDASDKAETFKVICLVTEDIPERMKEKLLRLGNGRLEFEYINLGGRLKDVYTDEKYTEAASFRLLMPDILSEYKSIVYIDCDIIVRQDIARLYKGLYLGDNYLAVVFEAPVEGQAQRFEALGCNPSEYFNSGFLVMNLEQMRQDNITEKLLDACRVDYLEFPDQDALNQVCKDRVLPMSPIYNGIRTFFLPQYKKAFLKQYPKRLWRDVQKSGTIHYTGGKPWNLFTVKFGNWWKTYDSLPEEIKEEWTPDRHVHNIWKIYRIAPVRILVDTLLLIYRKLK